MNWKKTLAAVLLLAAVAGFYFFYDKPAIKRKAEEKENAGKLLSLDWDKVDRVTINALGGEIVVSKSGDGQWKVEKPYSDDADKYAVQSLVSGFRNCRPDRIIDDPQEDMKIYGFGQTSASITFAIGDASKAVAFGASHRIGEAVFARVTDDKRVFVVPDSLMTSLYKSGGDLREKKIFPSVYDEKPTRIELSRADGVSWAVERKEEKKVESDEKKPAYGGDEDVWEVVEPGPRGKADADAMRKLMDSLRDMRVQSVDKEGAPRTPENGLESAHSMLRVSYGKDKVLVVEIGAASGANATFVIPPKGYLATVPKSAVDNLTVTVGDLRDKSLAEFDITKAHSFILQTGPVSTKILRSVEGRFTSEDGKSLDAVKTEDILNRLKSLKGIRFLTPDETAEAAEALKAPAILIRVSGEDGGTLAEVALARTAGTEQVPSLVVARGAKGDVLLVADAADLERWPAKVEDLMASADSGKSGTGPPAEPEGQEKN